MIFQGRKPCLHSFKNDICFPAQPDICALTGNYDCLSINKFYPCSLCFFLTERLQIFACIRSARVGGGGISWDTSCTWLLAYQAMIYVKSNCWEIWVEKKGWKKAYLENTAYRTKFGVAHCNGKCLVRWTGRLIVDLRTNKLSSFFSLQCSEDLYTWGLSRIEF